MANDKALQTAVQEIDELVSLGERIIRTASSAGDELRGAELTAVMTWVSRVGHMIRKLAGENSTHEQLYQAALKAHAFTYIHSNNYAHIVQIHGVIGALQHELKAGLLLDIRRLLQAEIFADFLEMAEHLLREGFKDAAAVLSGGVLEDALRKLTDAKGLQLYTDTGRPLTIDPLNVALTKAGAYQPLTQKQITTWADVRNSAAHGHYDRYTAEDVKQMIQFVQRFCGDHLQ
jgi:hypothetical protein